MIGFTIGEDQLALREKTAQKSILEMYPDFNFVVTITIFKEKDTLLKKIRTISVSLCAVMAIISIIAFIAIGHWHPDGYIAFNILVVSIFCGIIFYVTTTLRISKLKRLYSTAYYIQSIEKCKEDRYKYAFIVSADKKWGLINIRKRHIVIPPTFDFIEWNKLNEFVSVRYNNHVETRDVYNNICV